MIKTSKQSPKFLVTIVKLKRMAVFWDNLNFVTDI